MREFVGMQGFDVDNWRKHFAKRAGATGWNIWTYCYPAGLWLDIPDWRD
jgi:hypothetical protein